jgi:thioredoxin reductase
MERGLAEFAATTHLRVRYGCRWESTRVDGEDFVLATSDGEYRTRVAVFAVGVAEPWRPNILEVEGVQQYGELHHEDPQYYANHRVFIVGKQNSGFEIASGLLPWARQIILASPGHTKLSVDTRSLVGVRARYVQPFEDWALAGGVVILEASIEKVERRGEGYAIQTKSSDGSAMTFEVDDVIAATGFTSPLLDLPQLGVTTFGQSRLPVQSPFWESASVPGIYFAGTIMQGAQGLKKHGIPSNSGAVQGYRYNARVLARHLAEKHFGMAFDGRPVKVDDLIGFLLAEASHGPELWHQRSYLARIVSLKPDRGLIDGGILPLAHFLDTPGPDAVAVALETNGKDDPYPAVYVRAHGATSEHLLPPHALLDFEGADYRRQLADALGKALPSLAASPVQ